MEFLPQILIYTNSLIYSLIKHWNLTVSLDFLLDIFKKQ